MARLLAQGLFLVYFSRSPMSSSPMNASNNYQVTITMTAATVKDLIGSGFRLCVLHAVKIGDTGARPTIWSVTQSIMPTMQVEWPAGVSAYTSSSPLTVGTVIAEGFQTPISNGDTLEVSAGGIGTLKSGGSASEITITNTTNTPFTSGFGRDINGGNIPFYAVPLYGGNSNQAAAVPKVLLNFTTKNYAPGTVVTSLQPNVISVAFGPSLLVDMTNDTQRQVHYDINAGWSWGGFAWARPIPATQDLTAILIE